MGFVESEITEPVASGVRIWSMYNHGFIIKTPSTVLAFDLVHGYPPWDYQIPDLYPRTDPGPLHLPQA